MTILIITDLECTCDEQTDSHKSTIPREEMEIIEIGAVAFDTETKKILDEFQMFVRPTQHKTLTTFCKQLTTIKQSDVDLADTIQNVYPLFENFIDQYPEPIFTCYGNFDFNQFKRECKRKNIKMNIPEYINVSDEVITYFNLKRKVGVRKALSMLGLKFVGQPHRGIDDAKNIANIVDKIGIP